MRSPSRKNPKGREVNPPEGVDLDRLADDVQYVGSPEHKRSPSFAGPPSPRPDASICDNRFLEQQPLLTAWLKVAMRKGAVSAYFDGDYPRYVWYKDKDEETVYEARLVNRGQGTYKGYPLEKNEWPRGINDVYG
jgi:hypothetical protein